MTEKHREILKKHWSLLTSYLNLTDGLMDALVAEKVLPPSMAEDIRAGDTPREKNERLLRSLKIVGNMAFKKFRRIIIQYGHVFVAELLWDDDKDNASFIEECDFDNYPSFKNSLNPLERKQLIYVLDTKIKSRLLKSEWRNNSEERLKKLKMKIDGDETSEEDLKKRITEMKAELANKNDMLRNIVSDYNIMNDDVTSFEHRHKLNTRALMMKATAAGRGDGAGANGMSDKMSELVDATAIKNSRLNFVDTLVCDMDQRLSTLLGEGEMKPFVSVHDLDEKTKRIKTLVRELEASVDRHTTEQIEVQRLLFPDVKEHSAMPLVQSIHKYLFKEQNRRVSLLKDIDTLSKKLRNIKECDTNSALKGLMQSAVTGKPRPEIVDFRFLKNHVALLIAEADHMNKKAAWRCKEMNSLKVELDNVLNKASVAVKRNGDCSDVLHVMPFGFGQGQL